MVKGRDVGDFGTGCRWHHALPRVSERLRRSSRVRSAAKSLSSPPQEAGGSKLRHFRDGTLTMLARLPPPCSDTRRSSRPRRRVALLLVQGKPQVVSIVRGGNRGR
eukprot:scaffold70434_cov73-Phaeocystis_antarctica.AAC.3